MGFLARGKSSWVWLNAWIFRGKSITGILDNWIELQNCQVFHWGFHKAGPQSSYPLQSTSPSSSYISRSPILLNHCLAFSITLSGSFDLTVWLSQSCCLALSITLSLSLSASLPLSLSPSLLSNQNHSAVHCYQFCSGYYHGRVAISK